LAEAVRQGRRREFAEDYARHESDVPDPLSELTVRKATLDWTAAANPEHQARLDLVRGLLTARKSFIVPRLPHLRPGHGRVEFAGGILTANWFFRTGDILALLANLSGHARPGPESFTQGEPVWGGAPPPMLPAWSVYATVGGA
jgi:maltooligosyltrehalose trehalohydrolase